MRQTLVLLLLLAACKGKEPDQAAKAPSAPPAPPPDAAPPPAPPPGGRLMLKLEQSAQPAEVEVDAMVIYGAGQKNVAVVLGTKGTVACPPDQPARTVGAYDAHDFLLIAMADGPLAPGRVDAKVRFLTTVATGQILVGPALTVESVSPTLVIGNFETGDNGNGPSGSGHFVARVCPATPPTPTPPTPAPPAPAAP